jgi:thiamine-phosphate pyrophosphorylase
LAGAARAGSGRPILALVTDRAAARRPLAEAVRAAVAAGADWVQIRERDLEGAHLLALAEEIAAAAAPAAVVVNRRADVALALGAGLHCGFDALPVADARRLLGSEARIGVSAHSSEEVEAAARSGASYAHLAPIFAPLSKAAARPALGLAALEQAARWGIPVLAQGGITTSNAAAAVAAGAAGVAVTGAILMSDDPAAATADLRRALDAARS